MTDFRSPTLGIHRSPLGKAKRWNYLTREPIVRKLELAKEKEEDVESLIDFSPLQSSLSPSELVALPSGVVEDEMEKIRAEFSAKNKENSTPVKMFLSSPALWKHIDMSSPMPASPSTSEPLLQQEWRSPARRNLFHRSDSASAA